LASEGWAGRQNFPIATFTLKTYTHPTADMQRQAREETERVLMGSK